MKWRPSASYLEGFGREACVHRLGEGGGYIVCV